MRDEKICEICEWLIGREAVAETHRAGVLVPERPGGTAERRAALARLASSWTGRALLAIGDEATALAERYRRDVFACSATAEEAGAGYDAIDEEQAREIDYQVGVVAGPLLEAEAWAGVL